MLKKVVHVFSQKDLKNESQALNNCKTGSSIILFPSSSTQKKKTNSLTGELPFFVERSFRGVAGADHHRLLQRPGGGTCEEDVDPGAVGHRTWDFGWSVETGRLVLTENHRKTIGKW